MRKLSAALLIVCAAMAPAVARAQQATTTITQRINATGVCTVEHPAALEARLVPVAPAAGEGTEAEQEETEQSGKGAVRRIGGYRVQVFSDNNPRTAKKEARTKAQTIADAFPHYPTYVVYTSPYWRLKVGDFRTRDEAEAAADEIKRAFPAYSREVRVVQDRINH